MLFSAKVVLRRVTCKFLFNCPIHILSLSLCSFSKFQVAIFLIQRNRHALIGRAIDDHDMKRVLEFLKSDPVKILLSSCSFVSCLNDDHINNFDPTIVILRLLMRYTTVKVR